MPLGKQLTAPRSNPPFSLPFWLCLKALFWLYLMSPFWLSFNSHFGSRSLSILASLQAPHRLFFFFVRGFIVPPPLLPVSAPQVAGLLPGFQISGRSRIRPFVWGGILPLFSHLACNLNTQNISWLTNRCRDEGAAEDKRLEVVQPQAGLMVSDWA